MERAKYQADRAERALLAVEPENRLVAGTSRTASKPAWPNWPKQKLRWLPSGQQPRRCHHAELEAVVTNLGELWSAPTTSNRDRKRLCEP